MVKKERTHWVFEAKRFVIAEKRALIGALAIFSRLCVVALQPRTAFLGLPSSLCHHGGLHLC